MTRINFLFLCFFLLAQSVYADVVTKAHPDGMTNEPVTFLSGGIGSDEVQAMKEVAKNYPLNLEFIVKSKPKNEYAANVKVKISDKHGLVVLDTVSVGPYLFVKLPDGNYHVEATFEGKTKSHRARVHAKHTRQIIFIWNQ